jgi:hypothetical protein
MKQVRYEGPHDILEVGDAQIHRGETVEVTNEVADRLGDKVKIVGEKSTNVKGGEQ